MSLYREGAPGHMVTLVCREGAPGHRECDGGIQRIDRLIADLDQAALGVMEGGGPRMDGTLQSYQDMVLNSARQLLEHIDPIRNAAKGEAENLGHLVSEGLLYLRPRASRESESILSL